MRRPTLLFAACLLIAPASAATRPPALRAAPARRAHAAEDEAGPEVLRATSWLVLAAVDDRGRRPFRPDAVFARHLLDRDAPAPRAGEALVGERGEEARWEMREVADDGGPEGRGAAWAHTTLEVPTRRVMLARVRGASQLFVNGDAFGGDVYRYGWPGVPVQLEAGRNELYVTGIRGRFALELVSPSGELLLDVADRTVPDLVVGADDVGPMGLLVVNASERTVRPVLTLAGDALFAPGTVEVGALRPLEVAKVAVPQAFRDGARASADVEEVVRAVVARADGVADARSTVPLRVVEDGPARRVTFRSRIDDSVQFFGWLPAADDAGGEPRDPSLVLSLHGAGVDALAQARCYSRRPGVWIAAPTNRRPYGFDWQDWGRVDAYEVRDLALASGGVSPRRVQVTGHSMGGHGTWHLAANDTDGFSAAAPSAGWCGFDTYGGRPEGALRDVWHAADRPSLTLELLDGLVQVPTFVLHGTKDTSVPVSEAEAMVAALTEAGAPPRVHLQEGAGHWWDGGAAPGTDCLDWPGIFELFDEHPEVAPTADVEWVSAGPGIDARHHDLGVLRVLDESRPFRVSARRVAADGADIHRIATSNVRVLTLDVTARTAGTRLEVDGDDLGVLEGEGGTVELERREGRWHRGARGDPGLKRPDRMGPFKRAFDRSFVLVVGTRGDDATDAVLLARARHDGQVWWYRGNGRAPIVTDEEWLAGGRPPCNVILYGNADDNAAWDAVLGEDAPLRATRGALRLGERRWEGDDLGAVFVAPRVDDPDGLVGAFASTGVRGARLGDTLAPFVSGVGYPDYALFDGRVLTEGDGGVLAAGWWDEAWQLPPDARAEEVGATGR